MAQFLDTSITGSLVVTGTVTAEEFHTEFVSASIMYSSGSTKFGDTADDNHAFTGSLGILAPTGDAILTIEADPTNANEGDNPRIVLKQDGGLVSSSLGMNGTVNDAFSGVLANGFYVNTNSSHQFAINGAEGLRIATSGITATGNTHKFQSTGDVEVIINADTDNITETDAPKLTFMQDGSHRMLHIGGNGTAAAADYNGLLDNHAYILTGDGHSGTVGLQIGTNASASIMIKPSGNVGINTTSPSSALHVGETTAMTSGQSSVEVAQFQRINASGDIKASTEGHIALGAKDSNSDVEWARISWLNANSSDSGWEGSGSLHFWTSDGSTVTRRMSITDTGRVGIGTTSPASLLDVNGTAQMSSGITENTHYVGVSVQHWGDGGTGMYFNTDEVDIRTASAKRLVVKSDGKVGIGTESPSYNLEVSGSSVATIGIISNNEGKSYLRMHTHTNEGVYFEADDGSNTHLYIKNAGNNAHLMAIDRSTGNVGIGEPAPTHRLHVSGTYDVVKIEGSGSANSSSLFEVHGNNGLLFAIDDDLSDSLFSVNTIAGLPVIEAFSDNRVVMGAFNQNDLVISGSRVGIGTESANEKLHVYQGNIEIEAASAGAQGVIFSEGGTQLMGIKYQGGQSGNPIDIFRYQDSTTKVRFFENGNVAIGSTSAYTVGGTAKFTIAGSSVLLSAGNSNTDLMYIRRNAAGTYQWQTYNGGNSGNIHLQPYGGNVGIATTSPSQKLTVTGNISGSGWIGGNVSQTRDKFRVWNDSNYTIGFKNGYTYGHINNDYAMSFQMNNDDDRGFWWGDTGHTDAQGAMALTTNGRLVVATSISVGEGQSITSPSSKTLYVSGDADFTGAVTASYFKGDGSALTNVPASAAALNEVLTTGNDAQGQDIDNLGAMTATGLISASAFDASSNSTFSQNVTVAGNINVGQYIYHNNDVNTYLRFQGDNIRLVAGDQEMIQLAEGAEDYVYINPNSNDVDLIVRGDTDSNLIRTDAANDKVGIGTATPSSKLHIEYAGGAPNGLLVKSTANRSKLIVSDNDTSAYVIAENSYASYGMNDSLSVNNININASGNVGIGTSTPSGSLHIKQSSVTEQGKGYETTTFPNLDGNNNALLTLDGHYTSGQYRSRLVKVDRGGNLPLYFQEARGTAHNYDNIVRIGTNSNHPAELQVFGEAEVRDVLRISDASGDQRIVMGNRDSAGVDSPSIIRAANGELRFGKGNNWNPSGSISGGTFTPHMTITKGGNVGIGVTTPSQKLTVAGAVSASNFNLPRGGRVTFYGNNSIDHAIVAHNSSGNASDDIRINSYHNVYVNLDSNNNNTDSTTSFEISQHGGGSTLGTPFFVVRGDGRVGINDSSPGYPLDVVGQGHFESDNASGSLILSRTSNSDQKLYLRGGNGSGEGWVAAEYRLELRAGVGGSTSHDLLFSTAAGEAMRVDASNNNYVGIGKNNPSYTLDVTGDIRATGDLRADDDIFIAGNTLRFTNDAASAYIQSVDTLYIEADSDNDDSGGKPIIFRTAGTTKMTLAGDGDLGIGTSTPAQKLDVRGNIMLSGSGRRIVFDDPDLSYTHDLYLRPVGSGQLDYRFGGGTKVYFNNHSIRFGDYGAGTGTNASTQDPRISKVGSGSTKGGLLFSTNNVSRVLISGSGEVGIGTTSPLQFLDVNGVAYFRGGTAENFGSGDTPSDTALIIDEGDFIYTRDNNNLRKLIGKTSDIIQIGATGTSLIDGIQLLPGTTGGYIAFHDHTTESARFQNGKLGIGTTAASASLQIGAGTSNTGNRSDVMIIGKSNSGGVVNALSLVNTAAGANSNGTAINFHNGNAWSPTGRIITKQDSSGTNTNSNMQFYTYNGGLQERIRITSDGKIGINTTNPDYMLDVNGDIGINQYIYHNDDSDTKIRFQTNDINLTAAGNNMFRVDGNSSQKTVVVNEAGIDSDFRVESDTKTHALFVEGATGNVGIGTSTPGAALTVNGNIEATEKSFNIEHPTKPGKRLIYGVLEGPEHGVYVRGKSTEKVIELPEVWTGLVHENSLTVQLTCKGKPFQIWVEDIRDNKVYINTDVEEFEFYYYVQGERKDVDKLIIERDAD